MSLRSKTLHALALTVLSLQLSAASAEPPHNVILFVPDGLRALKVTPETAPTMAAIRDKGVNFKNPHSLFPTFTTANASAMATGHYRRHRRLQQYHLHRLSGRPGRRHRDAVPGERRGAVRRR
jgi:Type I phosphodiesterase / nucleotide pyrophosphatase